jgi:hypothetical protein
LINKLTQTRIIAMIALHDHSPLSPKRRTLCSRENAQRVAARMMDDGLDCVSILRTSNPLRVIAESVDGPEVELEMRLA